MVIFSPQPLKKWIFLDFFVKVTPPGTVKMQKCAIFINGFYKMMMSAFKKSQNLKFEGIIL